MGRSGEGLVRTNLPPLSKVTSNAHGRPPPQCYWPSCAYVTRVTM